MLNRTNKLFLIILVLALFSVYCFVFGDSGLIMRVHLEDKKDSLERRIENLKVENEQLRGVWKRYRNGDYLVTESLKAGLIAPDEKVLYVRGLEEKEFSRSTVTAGSDEMDILTLRIIWWIISVLVVLFYIMWSRRHSAE